MPRGRRCAKAAPIPPPIPARSTKVRNNGRFGAAGLVAVVAYAAVAAVQILVWNPLAAVPGATLAEISGTLDATGETFDAPMVLGILAVGYLFNLLFA